MKAGILLLFLSFSTFCSPQFDYQSKSTDNYIYNGSKRYLASGTFIFGDLSLNFGKVSKGSGVLLISTSTNSYIPSRLGSTLYLFLENGKRLVLNKIKNDNLNGDIIGLYSISSSNLLNLSNSDISQIRYSIVPQYGGSSSNHTAENVNVKTTSIEIEISQFEYENLSSLERFDARTKYFPADYDRGILMGKTKYYKTEKYPIKNKQIETTYLVNNLFY